MRRLAAGRTAQAPLVAIALFLSLADPCATANAQQLDTPVTLTDLLTPGTWIESDRYRYKEFRVLESSLATSTDDILVDVDAATRFEGVSFVANSGSMTTSNPNDGRGLDLVFTVESLAGDDPIGASRVQIEGAGEGLGVVSAAARYFDGHPDPLSVTLGGAHTYGASSPSAADSSSASVVTEQLRIGTSAVKVYADFSAFVFDDQSVASVASAHFTFLQEELLIGGDYDINGTVDGRDFLIWQRNYGVHRTELNITPEGDGNRDGVVDAADLGIWGGNFGAAGRATTVTIIPEPTSLLLCLATIIPTLAMGRGIRHCQLAR